MLLIIVVMQCWSHEFISHFVFARFDTITLETETENGSSFLSLISYTAH